MKYTKAEAVLKANKMKDFIGACRQRSELVIGGMTITYERKSILGRIDDIKRPSLKYIWSISDHVTGVCEKIGKENDLRRSEIRELETWCYANMYDSLDKKARYIVKGVISGKIDTDDLSENQLWKVLTSMPVSVKRPPHYGSLEDFWDRKPITNVPKPAFKHELSTFMHTEKAYQKGDDIIEG